MYDGSNMDGSSMADGQGLNLRSRTNNMSMVPGGGRRTVGLDGHYGTAGGPLSPNNLT